MRERYPRDAEMRERFLEELGARVKALRRDSGMTQKQLAQQCGVDPSLISYLERGKVNVTAFVALRMAMAFGVGLEDLLPELH